eukprot:779874-Pelagomonas_calceolata.AAC.1
MLCASSNIPKLTCHVVNACNPKQGQVAGGGHWIKADGEVIPNPCVPGLVYLWCVFVRGEGMDVWVCGCGFEWAEEGGKGSGVGMGVGRCEPGCVLACELSEGATLPSSNHSAAEQVVF